MRTVMTTVFLEEGTRKLSNLLKVTELASVGASARIWTVSLKSCGYIQSVLGYQQSRKEHMAREVVIVTHG